MALSQDVTDQQALVVDFYGLCSKAHLFDNNNGAGETAGKAKDRQHVI